MSAGNYSTFYESLGKGKTGGSSKGGSSVGSSGGGSKASTGSFDKSKSDVTLDDVDQRVMAAYDQSVLALQKKQEEVK